MTVPYWSGSDWVGAMLNGTASPYDPNEWYVSIGKTPGDPWETPPSSWEVAGSRTHYTGGWVADPQYASDFYAAGWANDTEITCGPFTENATVYYVALSNGQFSERWVCLWRMGYYNTPMFIGDSIRYPIGGLKPVLYSP